MKQIKFILALAAITLTAYFQNAVASVITLALITPGDFTFTPKEVRDFADVIIETAFENPDINEFHTIVEDIVTDENIGYLGRLSKQTKADAGCGTGKRTVNIPGYEKTWTPKKTKIWIEECLDTLDQTFMVYLKKKGVDNNDWTNTDIADFLMGLVETAVAEDIQRIAWFSDEDAANADDSPAGVITAGVSTEDYTIIPAGFFKQLYAIVLADSNRRVVIARNAQATYALQEFDSTDTTNRVASGIIRDVIQKADPRLRAQKNKVLLMTESVAFQYQAELEAAGVEASFKMIQTGVSVLERLGVTIIAYNFWDRTIRADFDNGTSWYQPHRVVMTTKEQLMIGIDAKSSIGKWDIYYDKDSEKSNLKGGFKIDAKIKEDHMVQVAY